MKSELPTLWENKWVKVPKKPIKNPPDLFFCKKSQVVAEKTSLTIINACFVVRILVWSRRKRVHDSGGANLKIYFLSVKAHIPAHSNISARYGVT